MIKLTVKGLNELVRKLQEEERNTLRAIAKAHSKAASEAVRKLKRGLNKRHGKDPSDPKYKTSPKGAMPYGHSMRLRSSIGYRLTVSGRKIGSEVGSGAAGAGGDTTTGNKKGGQPIEYAKYLEGRNHDGIRPFLWYADDVYNVKKINELFWKYFKPLSGGSGK